MKKNARASWIHGVAVLGLVAASTAAQAAVVYDNSETPLNVYYSSTAEFGDQITIGSGWTADSFRFEYFAGNLSGDETAKIRFYRNDGIASDNTPFQGPGSVMYESPPISLTDGNIPVTIENLAPLGIELPDTFTWAVSVKGLTAGEIFGLNLYDPPTTGTSNNDIWQFTINGWELTVLDGLPAGKDANFGAVLTAVPEPGSMAILALGGIALMMRRRMSSR